MVASIRTSVRSALLIVTLGIVAALLPAPGALGQDGGSSPLDQLPPPGPVPNSVQQAYRAIHLPEQTAGPVDEYFFTGTPQDQLNKLAGNPSATFGPDEPAGSSSIRQLGDSFSTLNEEAEVGDPASVMWTGDFSGVIGDEMQITWWWSSANAASFVLAQPFQVTIWADPDLAAGGPQTEQVIADEQVDINAQATPTQNVSTVQVSDLPINSVLHIQARPLYIDGGHELRVDYGSAATPSGFAVPSGAGGPVEEPAVANEEVAYDGELLALQASYVGRQAAEPTLGVLDDGTAVYAAGAFDGLPGQLPTNVARTEVMRSTDGGLTWASIQPPLPGGVTTDPATTLDPYVYVDQATDRIFNPELYGGCTNLHYSDDGGETWTSNRVACGKFINDHQTLFAGPPPEGVETDGYPNVLYYCFNRVIDSNCGRSLDGGDSWEGIEGDLTGDPLLNPAYPGFDPENGGLCGGLHGHIQTDSQGRLFVPKGHCGYPFVAISEDGAETWTRVRVSDQLPSGGLGGHTHLAIAADLADNLYFMWWDTDLNLPWLSVSTDHGQSWSDPLMVAPPGVVEVNFPMIDAFDEGHIAITFPGTTINDPEQASTRPWNSYVVVSTNADEESPLFLSATGNDPSDPIHRGACSGRCGGMYDFLDVVIAETGEAWATTSDGCTDITNKCISEDAAASTRGHGIAIRQIGGPGIVQEPSPTPTTTTPGGNGSPTGGTGGPTTSPTTGTPGPTTTPSVDDDEHTPLPTTGGGLAVTGALGLLVAAATAATVRRSRRV